MAVLRIGSKVRHARFGNGIVLELVAGRRVRVLYFSQPGLPRTVFRSEVLDENGNPLGIAVEDRRGYQADLAVSLGNGPPPRIRPTGPFATDLDPADARQTVEAIRLGVVPAKGVKDYTVAREEAIASFGGVLESRQGLRLLWGDYGVGKSHLLDVFETIAHDHRFVTARVALDPHEIPPSNPQRLFRALVQRLRLPNDAGWGLDAFFDHLVESKAHREPEGARASRFFSPYLHARHVRDENAIEATRSYLLGDGTETETAHRALRHAGWRGPRILVLSDYRTFGRVYLHLFGVLASWARDAGFAGLLLLLDEVEYVDGLHYHDAGLAREVLKHFAAATLPLAHLGFNPDELYKGGHEVHRSLPLRFEEDQPLAVVLAATPLEKIRAELSKLARFPERDIELRPPDEVDLVDLIHRIYVIYGTAYPGFSIPQATSATVVQRISAILRGSDRATRALVRTTVALFDQIRYGGTVTE